MADRPTHVLLDQTLALLREGYDFLPNRRHRYGSDVYEVRVLGQRTVCLVGADAAELLYDESRFRRAGAMPRRIRATLVGEGGVQGLDDAAHRGRKTLFMNHTTRVDALVELTGSYWREAIAGWRGPVVLFDEAARVFARAVCDWLGVPLPRGRVADRTRDLVSLVDGFAAAGPRHWRARRARRRCEAWVAAARSPAVGDRTAALAPSGADRSGAGAAAARAEAELGQPFRDLDPHTAAVELLNLIRPTVAVAWFVAFAWHALHGNPQWRDRIRDDEAALGWFVDEVRRFYPFTPAVGARVREEFHWRGHRFPAGRLVLLDVPGSNRDPRVWTDPDRFDPTRFAGRRVGEYEYLPQGGGNPWEGHRCAGEPVTVALMKESLRELLRHEYEMPPQDLTIPWHRIPTRPRSGIILRPR